jgi:hypothetical protein
MYIIMNVKSTSPKPPQPVTDSPSGGGAAAQNGIDLLDQLTHGLRAILTRPLLIPDLLPKQLASRQPLDGYQRIRRCNQKFWVSEGARK